ncbi:MAG: hypothetical protein V4615_00295 [Bacteroidota bacterium]
MADWLLNAARQLQLTEATIDILNQTIHPPELNLYPLIFHLKDLPIIIEKELRANGFPSDFISDAKIRIEFTGPHPHGTTISCFPTLTDKEGHKYQPGRIFEEACEAKFNPFDSANIYPDKPSFFDRIKSIFN